MFAVARGSGRSLLVLGAVAAIALAACNGSTATSTPSAAPSATPATETSTPEATASPVTGCDLTGAGAALTNLSSYKFTMTLAGGAADTALATLQLDQADSYPLKGTIVNQPQWAADITIAKFHLIEVGGFDYFDPDGNGTFTQVGPDSNPGASDSIAPDASATAPDAGASPSGAAGPGLAEQFSPAQIYQTTVASSTGSGYSVAGTETKDNVQAIHCTAGSQALEQYGSTLGVTDATWTSDIWLATDGGYPVSIALVAKMKDNSLAYEFLLDLSNVNDAANKVTAPTNIGGA
jgi:hypothetical protein